MAIQGIPVNVTAEYVSDLDPAKGDPAKGLPDQDGATRFTLSTLDSFAAAHVANAGLRLKGDDVELTPCNADVETVRLGLRGWTNMQDAKGADIPFKTERHYVMQELRDVVAPDTLKVLPLGLVQELANRIRTFYTPPAAPSSAAAPSAPAAA